MSGFDSQKILDKYIYDYLRKKNMRATAQIFAQEADVCTDAVALDEEDGFLSEWWSNFWEAYSNRPGMNSDEATQLLSQAKQNFESMPGNVCSKMPVDVSNSLQNADPNNTMLIPRLPNMRTDVGSSSMARPGIGDFRQSRQTSLLNLSPAVGPPFMARPNIGNFLQSRQTSLPSPLPAVVPSFAGRPDAGNYLQWPPFPNLSTADIGNFLQNPHTSLPNLSPTIGLSPMARPDVGKFPQSRATATNPMSGQYPDRSGIVPPVDFVIGQGLNVTTHREPRMRELERVGLPSGELNLNSQSPGTNQSASKIPSSSNPRRPKRNMGARYNRKLQDTDSGIPRTSFHVPAEQTVRATRVSKPTAEPAETGYDPATPPSSEPALWSSGLSGNLVGSSPDDGSSKEKELASGNDEVRWDDEAVYFSLNELLGDVSTLQKMYLPHENVRTQGELIGSSSLNELLGDVSPSQEMYLPHENVGSQEFPFKQVVDLRPTNNKLLCCHFSTAGRFFAAAGHEKKVYIFDLKKKNSVAGDGHTQLITDVRFKPSSDVLATSSFDKTIRIWDAGNQMKLGVCLAGHAEQAMSLDFHPTKVSLLCSCDSHEEIRFWDINSSKCINSFKGANRHVRFQPLSGKLLAAASGNVINLFDVEYGRIYSCFEGHAEEINSICWHDDGKMLVSASDDSVRVWSAASGSKSVHELHCSGNKFASCTSHPENPQTVIVGSYQDIDIWILTMGRCISSYKAHERKVSALSHSSQIKSFASVGHDQSIKIWNETGAL